MKTLADGNHVSARSFYYLLDFNDRDNFEMLYALFNKKRLMDLNITEYIYLFEKATEKELINLRNTK
jgi:hypothetical protein